jgi:hypothetical protein
VFGIDDRTLIARVDHKVHRLQRQDTHERLVTKDHSFGHIGSILKCDFNRGNFRDFDLAAVGKRYDLLANLRGIKAQLNGVASGIHMNVAPVPTSALTRTDFLLNKLVSEISAYVNPMLLSPGMPVGQC